MHVLPACYYARAEARRHPLAQRQYLRCSPPGPYPGRSSPSPGKAPSSSFSVKTPSPRVFCAFLKSLLLAMADLRGHCCGNAKPLGSAVFVPPEHDPFTDNRGYAVLSLPSFRQSVDVFSSAPVRERVIGSPSQLISSP